MTIPASKTRVVESHIDPRNPPKMLVDTGNEGMFVYETKRSLPYESRFMQKKNKPIDDIRKIKKLISEKENDKLDTAFVRKTVVCNNDNDEVLEAKNYDLKEVLDDAKKSRPKEENERYVQN